MSDEDSCDRRFEKGLRPLAKLYFDEACVVALDTKNYNCPMNALNVILEQYIGGLRVEAFFQTQSLKSALQIERQYLSTSGGMRIADLPP